MAEPSPLRTGTQGWHSQCRGCYRCVRGSWMNGRLCCRRTSCRWRRGTRRTGWVRERHSGLALPSDVSALPSPGQIPAGVQGRCTSGLIKQQTSRHDGYCLDISTPCQIKILKDPLVRNLDSQFFRSWNVVIKSQWFTRHGSIYFTFTSWEWNGNHSNFEGGNPVCRNCIKQQSYWQLLGELQRTFIFISSFRLK